MKYKTVHFPSIDSTNTYLKEHFEELDDFTFVSADYQTRGKGRHRRVWLSNEKENLLFSVLIKNKDIVKDSALISVVAVVSVCQVLEKYHFKFVQIKWPNDIHINGKKMVGILLEGRIPEYLVIGVGINVNQKIFKGRYRRPPTSLALETGHDITIDELKKEVYKRLFDNLHSYSSNEDAYHKYYYEHNYLIGGEVSFRFDNAVLSGTVKGVDENYNIIIESDGEERHISSGEIELLRKHDEQK